MTCERDARPRGGRSRKLTIIGSLALNRRLVASLRTSWEQGGEMTFGRWKTQAKTKRDYFRVLRGRTIITVLIVFMTISLPNTAIVAQPFSPIRELTTWYTDQGLIDIEIVG